MGTPKALENLFTYSKLLTADPSSQIMTIGDLRIDRKIRE